MAEIRFQPSTQFPTLAGTTFSRGPDPQGIAKEGPAAPGSAAPDFRPASVGSLLGSRGWAPPNVFEAAPLLQVQSHAAAQITNPSSTPEQPEQGVDARTGLRGTTSANAVAKALTRATSTLGQGTRAFGSVAGLAGAALALPSGISDAVSAIDRARQTGSRSDVANAVGTTSTTGSTATRLVKHGIETYSLGASTIGHSLAGRAGAQAFRQAAPGASEAVIKAAAKQAGKEAMQDSAARLARRGVTSAATAAAKGGVTVARGAGVVGRTAAKRVLQEGGEAAAKAAAKAVATGALKTGAKAAGRFVPGLNIAIAGLDTAAAAATLADPKASTGKKVTSCITAAGSIVAATNIPVVSQVGAAVSTVSSFVGSFF